MKNVVYYDTGKETEFKPNALFEKYLKLLKVDLIKEFKSPRIKLSQCPACRSKRKTEAFVKFGYSYNECLACGSVYMSPRPSDEDLKTHYLTSVSAKYWRETLSEATLKKRKEKIYENRFQWMYEVLKENKPEASSIADFNSRNQAFSNEFMNWSEISQKAIVNPYFISEIDSDYTKGSFDAVCAFEIIDNTSDVEQLLRNINRRRDMLFNYYFDKRI
jgi:Zn ribbon nucleic-acid-binding protein